MDVGHMATEGDTRSACSLPESGTCKLNLGKSENTLGHAWSVVRDPTLAEA